MVNKSAPPTGQTPVRHLDINDEQDTGQRLDNYLLRTLKGVPRQLIYKIIRRGEVRVNAGRVSANYRLQLGDRIRVPPLRQGAATPRRLDEKLARRLLQSVVFEDDNLLVLNKPEGVAVHGGSNVAHGVIETLRLYIGNERLELVHRLDRDTSGCLAVAKNRKTLAALQAQFRSRQVKKVYEAFVWGQWPTRTLVVQLKLQRYETPWGERRVRVDAKGQSARTDFQILEQGALATRLQARLHTGRTHQIRVHTSASGHSIIGDDKYAPAQLRKSPPLQIPRLCLHARKLSFWYDHRMLKFEAPVPQQMNTLWAQLKSGQERSG